MSELPGLLQWLIRVKLVVLPISSQSKTQGSVVAWSETIVKDKKCSCLFALLGLISKAITWNVVNQTFKDEWWSQLKVSLIHLKVSCTVWKGLKQFRNFIKTFSYASISVFFSWSYWLLIMRWCSSAQKCEASEWISARLHCAPSVKAVLLQLNVTLTYYSTDSGRVFHFFSSIIIFKLPRAKSECKSRRELIFRDVSLREPDTGNGSIVLELFNLYLFVFMFFIVITRSII